MEWMKRGLKFLISKSSREQKEFEEYNNLLLLSRIRLISWASIFLLFFWVYMDWKIINNGADRIFSMNLVIMHLISGLASALFLVFYKWVNLKGKIINYRIIHTVLIIYVFLYLFFGGLSSINSQRYTGNIYSYIILSLIAAIALSLKPSIMLFAYGINHIIFLVGISILNQDITQFLTKLINSTVLAVAAFLLSFNFYRHRMMEFLYRKKLAENEESFKKLFYANPYPVFITRLGDGKIIEANKKACSLMGINTDSLNSFNEISSYIKNDSRLALQEELREYTSTYNRIVEYTFNGKHMWITANYELIDYHGEKCVFTGIMDMTEIRKTEEELSHYACIDSLTGILNRRMGFKRLEELMAASRERFLEFALCFVDINNLKYVNDTHGHSEGDRCIITICHIIKNKLNEEDIFFRMGGDEFIIVFKNRNKFQAENIWSQIMKQFKEKTLQSEFPYHIMASHGLSYYRSGMDMDLDQIIEKADKRMYKEKQNFKKEYSNKYEKN